MFQCQPLTSNVSLVAADSGTPVKDWDKEDPGAVDQRSWAKGPNSPQGVTQGVTRLLLENLMSKPFSFIRLQAGICDPMKEKDVFRHLGVLQGISQEIPQAGAEAGATRCMEGDP